MKIKDLPTIERPREKLVAKGPENVRDVELLAILLRTGRLGKSAIDIAADILSKHSKKRLLQMTYDDLIVIKGIDSAKAATLLAAFELSRRALQVNDSNLPVITCPQDMLAHLTSMRDLKREHLVALYLNARNQLVHHDTISVGTINANLIHPREVFEPAVQHLAAQVIVAHNHPSGDAEPSEEDITITKRLQEAGNILGIQLLDHIIIGKTEYRSLKQIGLL